MQSEVFVAVNEMHQIGDTQKGKDWATTAGKYGGIEIAPLVILVFVSTKMSGMDRDKFFVQALSAWLASPRRNRRMEAPTSLSKR